MRRNTKASIRLVAATVAVGALLAASMLPAGAVNIGHGSIVSETPASGTPNIRNGRVNAVLVMGNRVFVGGTFTTVRNAGSTTDITRNYLFSFDVASGAVDTQFRPNLDRGVEALAPGPDGTSIYVGGKFVTTNGQGTPYRRLVRLNSSNGSTITSFAPNPNDWVLDLTLRNGQLYAAGEFIRIGGAAHSGMARLNTTNGTADPSFDVQFTDPWAPPSFGGTQETPVMRVFRIDVTPDGSRLVATGNFRQVDGQDRDQIAILNTGSNPVTLTNWDTEWFQQTDPNVADQNSFQAAWCIFTFPHYIRDIDISPDGSYFAAVTTGANWLHPSCDSMSRWDLSRTGGNLQPEWVSNTGGDSFHSVLVTGAAIYGGGHQQYVNNPYNPNRCGVCENPYPGGVSRIGFSAHDPRNGIPFTWNPVRQPRGKGVLAMMSTATGFYFGSDTDRIHGLTRQKLAFMPLAGGVTQAPENPYTLPGNFYTVGQSGSPDALLRRSFNGTFGSAASLSTGWSNVHGAFALNGRLYTGQSDGTLTVRSFNGTTAGSTSALNLYGLENAPGPQYTIPGTNIPIPGLSSTLPQLTGMAIDQGYIYYTVQGDPRLYARGFTQQSQVLGALLQVPSTGDNVDWGQVRGMTIASGKMYFALSDGTLNVVNWNGAAYGVGHPTGSVTTIGGPGIDGTDWSSNAFFVYN